MSTTENVREAYEYCRNVTLKYAKTFYFASIFLPKPKRNACYAVYAFCRYIDDLIDENVTAGGGRADREAIDMTIARWRNDLDAVYAGRKIATPVMLAWGDTLRRFNIRRSLPDELIEGVMTDLRQSVRFDTFGQLHDYCYKVASVVGLMTSEIFGYSDPVALRHAVDLGIGARRVCENFRRMMAFQIERAHAYYDSADIGIAMLEGDSRLTVTLMSHNYRRILGVIERNGYDVFSSRASVPLHRKLMTIPVLWYVTR
jgi:phytoene synthase